MNFLNEGIILGIDALILGLCVKEYYDCKRNIRNIEDAPTLSIDSALKNLVDKKEDKKLPYAIIRGSVTPLGVPLRSPYNPNVTCVINIHKLTEQRMVRAISGFWINNSKLLHFSPTVLPFAISANSQNVEILEPLNAEILDLDLIYDNCESNSFSFFNSLLDFVMGVRHRGFRITEEVLREGTYLTAIGELRIENDHLCLGPAPNAPLFLTTATKSTLVERFKSGRNYSIAKIVICGAVAALVITIILRKLYSRREIERKKNLMKKSLAERRKARTPNYSNKEPCVICLDNPKEVICLPCGHVCMCTDCPERINKKCPVCRANIDDIAPAFIV